MWNVCPQDTRDHAIDSIAGVPFKIEAEVDAMASLSVRISLDPDGRIGPGKIDLLEEIAACGSISGAGRKMAMSYRRAWELVEDLNGIFETPVVARQIGGRNGGGATLTPLGFALVTHYRAIEKAAQAIAQTHLDQLQNAVSRHRETDEGRGTPQAGLRSTRPLAR